MLKFYIKNKAGVIYLEDVIKPRRIKYIKAGANSCW